MPAWTSYLRTFLTTLVALLALVAAFVVLMNPYGNLPGLGPWAHAIMDTNQRFQYPAIVRGGDYDSAVFGTSTSRLLDPARLEAAFGGHFANLAMDDGRAWEQSRLARLFLRHVPHPRTLLVALDEVWCRPEADRARITVRGFPEWMYDESPFNDWLYVLSTKAVEIAARQLGHRLGFAPVRIPANGYEVFVPPESEYDAAKAQANIWRGREPALPEPQPPYEPSRAERAAWRFPAIAWLGELMAAAPPDARVILAFMPLHASNLPTDPAQAARLAACKAKVVETARRHRVPVVDFWRLSAITREDTNYWDNLHYRVPIADRIVIDIAAAVLDRKPRSADYQAVLPTP